MAGIALLVSATLGFTSACKRQGIVAAEGEAEPEPAAGAAPSSTDVEPPASVGGSGHFLDPLLGAPWLGHADDGALVRIQFFVSKDGARALSRMDIVHAFGGAPTSNSPFTATADLSNITWDDGRSRASFDPAAQTVVASIAFNARTHQVRLRQVSAASHPELKSFRTSIPDDERVRAHFQNVSAAIKSGVRWWKSIDDWGKLVTPNDIVLGESPIAQIRPADKTPPKIPALGPGGHFNLAIECHLPPGSALSDADSTIGIVAELHHSGDVQATWIISRLNPGAISQTLEAHWLVRQGDEPPSGEATVYVYLAKTSPATEAGEGEGATEIANPISNLLQIQIDIGKSGDASTTAPPPEQ